MDTNKAKRKKDVPVTAVGTTGAVIYGGYLQTDERNPILANSESRYRAYSDILANTSIVAAGVRYFLNLIAKAAWTFDASEADADRKYAKLAEEMLLRDPKTPWHRVVRRSAMYRFYGFSIQEWTAKRRVDGHLTFADISPRPQRTIYRWGVSDSGEVEGVYQLSPQTNEQLYLERSRILYMVDDALSSSPEGLGLFRHLIVSTTRLSRLEQLEGFGYETDLRGIPVARAPFTDLAEKVARGEMTEGQRLALEAPMRSFVENHIKSASIGLLLDSIAYETKDEAETPSAIRQWDIEILKGSATSFAENAAAIERINREIARILGVEQLLLGSGNAGSFALSRDKTSSFFLLVDSALTEIRETVADDLLTALWDMNGWEDKYQPTIKTESLRYTDVSEVAASLRDLGMAGAILAPDDPVISDVRDMLGVSRPPED